MWRKSLPGLAVVFLLAVSTASADTEEVVCEHAKLNTSDASPLDPGAWEFAFSYGLARARSEFDNHWGRMRRPLARGRELGLGITYGLVEHLDVSIGIGHLDLLDRSTDQRHGHGFTDLEVAAKWRFYYNGDRRLELAYIPAIVIPTGERETARRLGTTDDFVSIYNGISASKDWTDRATSNFGVGFAWPVGEDRGDYRGTLSADAAFGYQVLPWLQPEVELNLAHDFCQGRDSDVVAATAGFIIGCFDGVRLDVGYQQVPYGRNADRTGSVLATLVVSY